MAPTRGPAASDDRAIARWRLRAQRLSGPRYPSATAVVDGMLAVQAEVAVQAGWAVGTRATDVVEADIDRLRREGELLRTHVLRPTWHLVRPADIRWLLALTGPRLRSAVLGPAQREHGIDGAVLARSTQVVLDQLVGGRHATRPQIAAALEAAGLPAEGLPVALILLDAELQGLVCSGPPAGRDHTYALLEERVAPARPREPEEARAELIRRYLTGHGPATVEDIAYWATMATTDVRAGLADLGDTVEPVDAGGRRHFATGPPGADLPPDPRGHLLQILDEYHNGFATASRHATLDGEGIVPRTRPRTYGMALVDGQMVGGMRRTLTRAGVRFEVDAFRPLAADEVAALQDAAGRYGTYLGRAPDLVISG